MLAMRLAAHPFVPQTRCAQPERVKRPAHAQTLDLWKLTQDCRAGVVVLKSCYWAHFVPNRCDVRGMTVVEMVKSSPGFVSLATPPRIVIMVHEPRHSWTGCRRPHRAAPVGEVGGRCRRHERNGAQVTG